MLYDLLVQGKAFTGHLVKKSFHTNYMVNKQIFIFQGEVVGQPPNVMAPEQVQYYFHLSQLQSNAAAAAASNSPAAPAGSQIAQLPPGAQIIQQNGQLIIATPQQLSSLQTGSNNVNISFSIFIFIFHIFRRKICNNKVNLYPYIQGTQPQIVQLANQQESTSSEQTENTSQANSTQVCIFKIFSQKNYEALKISSTSLNYHQLKSHLTKITLNSMLSS